jgi:hypothetical protein
MFPEKKKYFRETTSTIELWLYIQIHFYLPCNMNFRLLRLLFLKIRELIKKLIRFYYVWINSSILWIEVGNIVVKICLNYSKYESLLFQITHLTHHFLVQELLLFSNFLWQSCFSSFHLKQPWPWICDCLLIKFIVSNKLIWWKSTCLTFWHNLIPLNN